MLSNLTPIGSNDLDYLVIGFRQSSDRPPLGFHTEKTAAKSSLVDLTRSLHPLVSQKSNNKNAATDQLQKSNKQNALTL